MAQTDPASAANRPGGKLSADLERVRPHLRLDGQGEAALAGCMNNVAALERLEQAGLLIEATRLVAHALPAREAVWWACTCARHTAASADNPQVVAKIREAAEEWVRRQTDGHRRAAMAAAEAVGFNSAEAWAAVAAFWSGDSMTPLDAPKVPPQPHFAGLAVAGAVALAATRGPASRYETRLRQFLLAAHDIAQGGTGRSAGLMEVEPD